MIQMRSFYYVFHSQIPHPLEQKMVIRIQTRGKETPLSAMKLALRMLHEQSQKMTSVFDKALGEYMKHNQ